MLLSIVVPVYNVKDYVIKCLESVYNQTLQNYEVIVVDDGSTDGSGEIVDEYCRDKEQFHVFHKTNGGLMSAWMEGVEHSTGDYIGFVDSDDYVHETMFQQLTDIATEHNCDIVMCDHFSVNPTPKHINYPIRPGLYTGAQMEDIRFISLPKFSDVFFTNARWAKVFKKEILLANIVYCKHRSRFLEDRFITPACFFSAKRFYYLNEPLYFFVSRADSNSNVASSELQNAFELLTITQKKMLKDKGLLEKYDSLVDRANLKYLVIMIHRNFGSSRLITQRVSLKERLKLAKSILNNEYYQSCVRIWKKDLTGFWGFLFSVLFIIKSPLLFVFVGSFSGLGFFRLLKFKQNGTS